MALAIPAGWYVIRRDEVILKGDKFEDTAEWYDCHDSVGGTPNKEWPSGERIIRKGTPPPPPEKVWLNPWD